MSGDWWAFEAIAPLYDLECPVKFCDRHFRRYNSVHAHLRNDHALPYGMATWKLKTSLG